MSSYLRRAIRIRYYERDVYYFRCTTFGVLGGVGRVAVERGERVLRVGVSCLVGLSSVFSGFVLVRATCHVCNVHTVSPPIRAITLIAVPVGVCKLEYKYNWVLFNK